MKYRKISLALLGLVAGAAVSSASAATFLDTSLTSPGFGLPGVYYGAGNANSNFTVDRTGNTEVGLSAIQRFQGPIVPTGSTYFVSTAAASDGRSDWGVTFSVNINVDGTDTKHNLSNVSAILSLQDLGSILPPAAGFDLLAIGDNTEVGSGGKCIGTFVVPCNPAANYAFQNSETLSFAAIAAALGDPTFDFTKDDTYIFTLSLFNTISNTLISTDRITVIAGRGAQVPEPLTISLFAAGLVGAGALRRRKSKKVQA